MKWLLLLGVISLSVLITGCAEEIVVPVPSTGQGGGTTYLNGTGLNLSNNTFSLFGSFQLPQSCNDGEIAEYNTSSGEWDCAVDNATGSGMTNWLLSASGTSGNESITDGETVTMSVLGNYIRVNRSDSTVFYWLNESYLNITISNLDTDTFYIYTHLSNFTDDVNVSKHETFINNMTGDCPEGNYSYGRYPNGSVKCRDDEQESGGVGSLGAMNISTLNLTSGTYNGSITNGSLDGYAAAHNICRSEHSGTHMCTEFEISSYIDHNNFSWLNEDFWVVAGGPKYVPADIPVNDCNGWQHGVAGSYLGNYWKFNSTTGGKGAAINCGTSLKLGCCK